MHIRMRANDLVLVQGMRDTRGTLAAWNRAPWPVLRGWLIGSFAVSVALLLATWLIGTLATPDPSPASFPGLTRPPTPGEVGFVLLRNSLVLALHGFACVAGFIAGSSLPRTAQQYSGVWRWVHEKAGPLAIAFVVGATAFSLGTQAYVLGNGAAQLSAQLGISPALLVVGLLPHALPELMALFLPLAAWLIASHRGEWSQLLAATFVTVGLAAPILIASSVVEVYVTPDLLRALAG
jgi:hypothetical protein